jgi:hypothetical protein
MPVMVPAHDPGTGADAVDPPLPEVELHPAGSAMPSPKRHMRILGLSSAAELVEHVLDEALQSLVPVIQPERAKLVAAQARRAFLLGLRETGRPVRGIGKRAFLVELERSKSDLLVARDRLRGELAGLVHQRDLLEEIRGAPTVAAAPTRLQEELRRSLHSLLAHARDPAADLAALEAIGLAEILEVVRRDRERADSERSAELALQLDVHGRRIEKLSALLAQSERALAELARLKDVDPGIASIYRTVQGLNEADALARAKHDALDKIFQANLALRMALASLPAPTAPDPLRV